MVQIVEDRLEDVRNLCRKYNVRRLEIFGSAARTDFKPESSDIDFIVEFNPMGPHEHANAFWDMLEELKVLFNRNVDFLEISTIVNPYFLAEISSTRRIIFE